VLVNLNKTFVLSHMRTHMQTHTLTYALGLAKTIYIHGVYTVNLAGKSPNIQSYTVYIYGSGQPYYAHIFSHMHTALVFSHSCTGAAKDPLMAINTRASKPQPALSALGFKKSAVSGSSLDSMVRTSVVCECVWGVRVVSGWV
jgi:hypothetical protein